MLHFQTITKVYQPFKTKPISVLVFVTWLFSYDGNTIEDHEITESWKLFYGRDQIERTKSQSECE